MAFNFYSPARILFGEGQLKKLHMLPMPGKKALIVISDGQTAYVSGGLEQLKEELALVGVDYAIYDKVRQNPTDVTVNEGVKVARANNVDFVIGLGGGSVMDSAKGISLMFFQEKDYWYYVDHGNELVKKWLPVITIATDAGTGSDSDPYMCIASEEHHTKRGFPGTKDLGTFPIYAVLDPTLMMTVPKDYTAFQGFDVLFHAIEGYICNKSNEIGDMYAEKAVELVGRYLRTAVNDGANMEARSHMAFANHLASIVMFASYTCSQHAIEHGMGGYFLNLPHGAGLLSFTKEWFQFFVDHHACDDRFVRLAQLLGKTDANKPEDFMTALTELMADCGVAAVKMSDYGITREILPQLVAKARETNGPGFLNDLVPLSDEETLNILERSYL